MNLKFLEYFTKNTSTIIVGVPDSWALVADPTGGLPGDFPCQVVEVRLDLLPGDPLSSKVEAAISACPLPVLLTARHPDEGGSGDLDSATRARIIRHHFASAAAIDLELRSLPELPELADLVSEGKSRGVAVIGSFHDFEKTPDAEFLAEVVAKADSAGVDIVKIATRLRSPGELARLINLLEDPNGGIPRAVMGMGPLGKVSRLTLAKCGSALTYGYLGSANVVGQWPAKSLTARLAELD